MDHIEFLRAAGRKGGLSRSAKKLKSLKRNIKRANDARRNPQIAAIMSRDGVSRQTAWYRLRKSKKIEQI